MFIANVVNGIIPSWFFPFINLKRYLVSPAAIIGIIGCADALKATSLIFGRLPNANKTTTTTTTTPSTTTTVAADAGKNDEVWIAFWFVLVGNIRAHAHTHKVTLFVSPPVTPAIKHIRVMLSLDSIWTWRPIIAWAIICCETQSHAYFVA